MCRLRNIAMRDYQESVTTKKVWLPDRRTDRRRTKWSLCAAMLRRRHKKWLLSNKWADTQYQTKALFRHDVSIVNLFEILSETKIKLLYFSCHRPVDTKIEMNECRLTRSIFGPSLDSIRCASSAFFCKKEIRFSNQVKMPVSIQ